MAEVALRTGARSIAPAIAPVQRVANRPELRKWARAGVLLRPLPLVLLLAWWAQPPAALPAAVSRHSDLAGALAAGLETRGLQAEPVNVFWLDYPPGALTAIYERPRAVLLARRPGEPTDVYVARVKVSPEGRLLDISGVYNISETSAVHESQLVVDRGRAAWTIGGGGKTYSVSYADLRGERPPSGDDWDTVTRAQQAITNLQDTGQWRGVGRRSFRLDPAASEVTLGFSDRALLVRADEHLIEIPSAGGKITGERFVRAQEHHASRPGNFVTWAVDRVRALPWFGNDRMQALKAIAFWTLDKLENAYGQVTGDDGAERVAEELGDLLDTKTVNYTDPVTGWPPAPIDPVLRSPLKGEGQWVSLEHDPFIRSNPEAPNPFVVTFLRTDRERIYSQIYITLWDPRQVQLHAMCGTKEPKSATGEAGPGLVPRTPRTMERLVGAFNGGFQATHGDFGMISERVVYLPPKPFAATVAELSDGSTVFGTWPREAAVPDNVVSLRQNLNPLVLDGLENPYKREWWGGVPQGWTDDSRTVRSGLCLTREHFVAYFYGPTIDAHHLAVAMQRARCTYGIHLDMNAGHTGLEFYRVAPKGQIKPLGRELDPQWEAAGEVPGMESHAYIGRRLIKYMALMNFPRYIQRDARDFFYLTLRPLLPGTALATAAPQPEPGEGSWQVRGLPQHGWPYAIATTWLRPDANRPETKVNVVQLDPKMLRPTSSPLVDEKTVIALRTPTAASDQSSTLWWSEGAFVVADKPPAITAERVTHGYPPELRRPAVAAVGVNRDGIAFYAEVATAPDADQDPQLLQTVLHGAGAERVLLLERTLGVAIAGQRDLAGHPVTRTRSTIHLVRQPGPGGARFFTDTPIVSPLEWYKAQTKPAKYTSEPRPPGP